MSNIQRYQQPGLVATNVTELEQMGKMCAASGFFQDARQAAQAMVKIAAGQELGLLPIQSMTGIHVIKNRVTLSANLMAALLKKAGYRWKMVQFDETVCSLVMIDPHGTEVGPSSFSMTDAKKAGLTTENWQKYPRNMLFARAISNAARWYAPEVITGCYTPEEMGSGIVDDSVYVEPESTPLSVPEPAPVVEADVVESSESVQPNNAMKRIHAVANERGITHEQLRDLAGVETMTECTRSELRELADIIEGWNGDIQDIALQLIEAQTLDELKAAWVALPKANQAQLGAAKDFRKARISRYMTAEESA